MIPLMVQVPEMAPIMKRMMMAEVTSPMLFPMASSKTFQGVLNSQTPSHTQMPAAISRTTWLAPRMESLPKMLISNPSSTTRTSTGIREIRVCFIWQ